MTRARIFNNVTGGHIRISNARRKRMGRRQHHQTLGLENLERREVLSATAFVEHVDLRDAPKAETADVVAPDVRFETTLISEVSHVGQEAGVDLQEAQPAAQAAYDIPGTFRGAARLTLNSEGAAYTPQNYISPAGDKDMYRFRATLTGRMTVDLVKTTSSDLDPMIVIFNGNRRRIASDDDSGVGRNSHVSFNVKAGRTYFAQAKGWRSSQGQYQMIIQTYTRFLNYRQPQWGGRYHDAEKSRFDADDDDLCWAAAASNVLAWTGWGRVGKLRNTDRMFRYFQNHWTDQPGHTYYAWSWWFDGVDRSSPRGAGWARENVQGGGFFPSVYYAGLIGEQYNDGYTISSLNNYVRSGYGAVLGIQTTGGGHAIAAWGMRYMGTSTTDVVGVYVTDSDDNKNDPSPPAPNRLRYYGVRHEAGRWYLNNYAGSNYWYIDDVVALGRRWSGASSAGAGFQQMAATEYPNSYGFRVEASVTSRDVRVPAGLLETELQTSLVPASWQIEFTAPAYSERVADDRAVNPTVTAMRWRSLVDRSVESLMAEDDYEPLTTSLVAGSLWMDEDWWDWR